MHGVKLWLHNFLLSYYPKIVISRKWKRVFGNKIDWENPRDINEKIQWLLVNTDTSEWSRLADKKKVRDYVKDCGLEHLLIPLYGTWEDVDLIPYEELPQKFVLKCNHDSGSTKIIDKSVGYDKEELKEFYNKKLNRNYGINGELHYSNIKPRCIIAEKYLEQEDKSLSSSIIDYKIWCFDGRPYYIMTCHNRKDHSLSLNVFDLDWKNHPEFCLFNDIYHDGKGEVPKPSSFDDMLQAAAVLSEGFPEVRVDFYEVGGKLYFGEMTFTSMCGMMRYYAPDFLKHLGDLIVLP